MVTASRYHDFSYGHRVEGHEGKCAHIHGHNGRVIFTVTNAATEEGLDNIGRVLDFGVIKTQLCDWIEDTWDHKFIVYEKDLLARSLKQLDPNGVWIAPFNPTAENFAEYLLYTVGPQQLQGTGCVLEAVTFEETRKCSATYSIKEK